MPLDLPTGRVATPRPLVAGTLSTWSRWEAEALDHEVLLDLERKSDIHLNYAINTSHGPEGMWPPRYPTAAPTAHRAGPWATHRTGAAPARPGRPCRPTRGLASSVPEASASLVPLLTVTPGFLLPTHKRPENHPPCCVCGRGGSGFFPRSGARDRPARSRESHALGSPRSKSSRGEAPGIPKPEA